MTSYRPLTDYELDGLTDEALLAQLRRARARADDAQAHLAISVFAFRYWNQLRCYAKKSVPADAADDVAAQAIEGAVKAAFSGETVAELRALLFRIAHNKVVDFHRSRPPLADPLADEHADDEQTAGAQPSTENPDTRADVLANRELVAEVRAELAEAHQRVITLCLIEGFDSDSTAQRVNEELPELDPPMSPNNVDQIKTRFRKALRQRIAAIEEDQGQADAS